MNTEAREKIALIVFAALVILGAGLAFAYLYFGHSWNVAASNIDESVGSLDGYSVILYEGKGTPAPPKKSNSVKSTKQKSSSADDAGKAIEEVFNAVTGGEREAVAEKAEKSGKGSAGKDETGMPESHTSSNYATVAETTEEYRGKGASVLVLRTDQPSRYSDGSILRVGDKRIGVFSVNKKLSDKALKKKVKYFRKHRVDEVVMLVSQRKFVKRCKGVDIVVSLKGKRYSEWGEWKDGAMLVSVPYSGQVGSVLVSPNSIATTKVIGEAKRL